MGRRILAYLPAAAWAVVLLWVGGTADLPATPTVRHLDKVLHFTAYGVLGVLLGISWIRAGRWPWWGLLLSGALLLGAVDEYRHSLMPARDAEFADWLADALGACTGFYLATRLARRSHERRRDE